MIHNSIEEFKTYTPILQVWDGVLAVPVIGILDRERIQIVMEKLLGSLNSSGCTVAILDISGVPTVNTEVAVQLLSIIEAVRLMGAECIISGIRPEIALTLVNLDIDLKDIKSRPTMARALEEALTTLGFKVVAQPEVAD